MSPTPDEHFYADRTILGKRLKWWRTNQGQTIESIAATLGVSTSTWGHWETGHSFPSGGMLLDLSRLTKLPLQILFCPSPEGCPFNHGGDPPFPQLPGSPCGERSLAPTAADLSE